MWCLYFPCNEIKTQGKGGLLGWGELVGESGWTSCRVCAMGHSAWHGLTVPALDTVSLTAHGFTQGLSC